MALTPQQIMMALQAQGSNGVGAPTPGVGMMPNPNAMQPPPADQVKPAKQPRTKLATPRGFTSKKRHPARGGY